ncbi:MAG: hypothetical protein KGL48_15500 [Sphingomonadales bacterium]|nr:hypothetical protein [Sphingomonadales bacterium]MDE2567526.1 hypothetical protein [Sphingomonadales bacterium]
MTGFRLFAGAMWLALMAFTVFVIARDGLNLLPVFFGDIAAGHWPGQFNADFLTFLALSGLWTAWRSGFSAGGIALGVVAFFFGGGFLLAYLFLLSLRHGADPARILLGVHADKGSMT